MQYLQGQYAELTLKTMFASWDAQSGCASASCAFPASTRPAGPVAAVERHRLGVIDELHPAALPRAVRREVAAEVVRRQLVELRVDARAVVALAVVLGHDLPVGVELEAEEVLAKDGVARVPDAQQGVDDPSTAGGVDGDEPHRADRDRIDHLYRAL
mgnify:CR=1 FL=1